MRPAHDQFQDYPEVFIVALARSGDREAFVELVRRRQSPVRNLMRRCCNDASLADDLAQQVFLKMWLAIRTLRKPAAFDAWLKRLAVNVWLQQVRKKDALQNARELSGNESMNGGAAGDTHGVGIDLDAALAVLSPTVRLCIVLSYQEGMSHSEIAGLLKLPLGTVKSHIRRGAQELQQCLSDYGDRQDLEA